MVEWWHNLIFYPVSILFGTLLGYFLTRLGAKRERKEKAREQLLNAGRSILVEVETNLKLAKQPFQNRLVPFVTSMWEAHKGEILRLPKDLQDTLYQVYVEIQMANALVQADIHQLDYGQGYYNQPYKEKSGKVIEKTEIAIGLLRSWLKQQGVEEVTV